MPVFARISLILGLLPMLLTVSCSDFLLKDISADKVSIISPLNNFATTQRQVTFRWELLDGAEEYEFRLVSPSFSNPAIEILDSVTTGNRLTVTLPSIGNYQWWVKARVGTYVSRFDTLNLRVIADTSLVNSTVQLISPTTGQMIGIRDSVDLLWQYHPLATGYEAQVATSPTFNSLTMVYQNLNLTTDGIRLINQLGQGLFYWRVRAKSATQFSNYSETRTFTIDLTPPNPALLVRPVHNFSISPSSPRDTFAWVSSSDAVTSRIQFVRDTMTLSGSVVFNADLNSHILTQTLRQALGANSWYWRVLSSDAALNERRSLWRIVNFL